MFNITDGTNYWIYTMTRETHNKIINSKESFIILNKMYEIENGDIIILFLKHLPDNGFVGLLQTSSGVIKKDGKLIIQFKSKNMFELIKMKDALSFIKSDIAGFKTPATFGFKFTRNPNTICDMPDNGQTLTEYLISVNSDTDLFAQVKLTFDLIKNRKKFNISKKIRFGSTKKNINMDLFIDESMSNSYSDSIKSNNNSSEDNSNISNNSNSDSETEEEEEMELDDDPNGYIPIMIVPCENFNLPDMNEEIYFVNHYKTCDKCDVTNNNNRELCSVLNAANVEFCEITDEKHAYFDPALEAYYKLKKYEPMGAENYPFVRVAYINNDHDIYDKCLLVSWCNLQAK